MQGHDITPGFLDAIATISQERYSLIERDGLGAVIDEIAHQLGTIILPSNQYVALTGNFFFRHDGKGNYSLMHACQQCSYTLSNGHKFPAHLDLFEFALDNNWLERLHAEASEAKGWTVH